MTFPELVRACPAIAELKADAASIAQNERCQWYERWIRGSQIFLHAVADAAEIMRVPRDEIRQVVLTGLLDAYFTAKRRRAKREG